MPAADRSNGSQTASGRSAVKESASHEILRPRYVSAPVVLASPHSGRDYPPEFVARSRLSPLALRKSEDGFVDELFAGATGCGVPLIRALFPRAYVDVNREPFELDQGMFADRLPHYVNTESSRVAAGLGTIARMISGGQDIYAHKLLFAEAAARIDRHYRPYHRSLQRLIRKARREFGYCILIDCHSMPSVGEPMDPDAGRGRTHFVVGDCFGDACAPYITDAIEETIARFGYTVVRNKPFAGGFTTKHYGNPRKGVHAVQIEINRMLYMDEARMRKTAGFAELAVRMTELVSALVRLTALNLAAE